MKFFKPESEKWNLVWTWVFLDIGRGEKFFVGRAAYKTRTKLENDGFGASVVLQKREGDKNDISAESAGLRGAGSRCPGSQPNPYLSLGSDSSKPAFV